MWQFYSPAKNAKKPLWLTSGKTRHSKPQQPPKFNKTTACYESNKQAVHNGHLGLKSIKTYKIKHKTKHTTL
jgi:hypothetical protein